VQDDPNSLQVSICIDCYELTIHATSKEVDYEDPNPQFRKFSLLSRIQLVKELRKNTDAPDQILLGAMMDTRYCILLSLSIYLETLVQTGVRLDLSLSLWHWQPREHQEIYWKFCGAK
jgi:hypothetical protein